MTLNELFQRIVQYIPWRDESTFLEMRDAVNANFPRPEPVTEPGVKDATGATVQFPPAPE